MRSSIFEFLKTGALNEQFEAGNKVLLHHTFFGSLPTEMGSGGLTFQILTAMGLKCYCGILTGLCPEENQLIVPDWMMKSMFVDDGHKVSVYKKRRACIAYYRKKHFVDFRFFFKPVSLFIVWYLFYL